MSIINKITFELFENECLADWWFAVKPLQFCCWPKITRYFIGVEKSSARKMNLALKFILKPIWVVLKYIRKIWIIWKTRIICENSLMVLLRLQSSMIRPSSGLDPTNNLYNFQTNNPYTKCPSRPQKIIIPTVSS